MFSKREVETTGAKRRKECSEEVLREREPKEYQKTRLRRSLVRYLGSRLWRDLVTKA
jgi:hypothetical protein